MLIKNDDDDEKYFEISHLTKYSVSYTYMYTLT